MHLVAAISSHGFGHLAQTAPVLNALRARLPDLGLTLLTGLPGERVARRVRGPFRQQPDGGDFGLLMQDALTVDVARSFEAYRRFHADWPARVEREAERLRTLGPDLVLANVSYLTLAAARRAGVPAVALGSLHWAAITRPYFQGLAGYERIAFEMDEAYAQAAAFLQLTPAMDMPGLHCVRVGPVAEPGVNRRKDLPDGRLVLVAMGGVGLGLPRTWPEIRGVTWIVPRAAGLARPDVRFIEDTGLTVSDLIASVDVVITKAGYGTFVEAAACGTPLLYVERPDWPEEPALTAWHRRVSLSEPIDRQVFAAGHVTEPVLRLLEAPRPAPVAVTGVAEAADWLAEKLGGF